MGLSIAAVVVTYNRPDELRLVVSSLLSQSRPIDKIIVFDNAGIVSASDTLQDYLGQIETIRSPENLGGAGGFASGLAHACSQGVDWIWLMDDDAVPESNALAVLLDSLPNIPGKTGVLCGAVREYGKYALQHRRYFNRWVGWESKVPLEYYQASHVEIDTGSFVGFLVASEAVCELGLPEAEFFLAYDDTDYSLRLKNAGWRLWLIPGSIIEHLRTPEARLSSSDFGMKHYFNIRNRIIVQRKHTLCPYVAVWNGVLLGFALWVLSLLKRKRVSGLKILFQAIRDGFSGRLGFSTIKNL